MKPLLPFFLLLLLFGGGRKGGGGGVDVVSGFGVVTHHHHSPTTVSISSSTRRKLVMDDPPSSPFLKFRARGGGDGLQLRIQKINKKKNNKIIVLKAASDEATTDDASSSGGNGGGNGNGKVNIADIAKYIVSTYIQYKILTVGLLRSLDKYVMPNLPTQIIPLKQGIVVLLFMFLSLRSRIASILDNSRPKKEELADGAPTFKEVKRPSWTPPRIAFPFIWLTITVLRGISSSLIYNKIGYLNCYQLKSLILHLCIGDTWNTITNVEKRQGVSALGVLIVWTSVWYAILQFYQTLPLAGYILMPSGIWITIASILTWTVWNMNDRKPLLPTNGDGKSAKLKISNLLQFQPNNIGGSEI